MGPLAARPWTRQYDAAVPAMLEYPDLPVHALLEDAARTHTDSVAIRSRDGSISYRALQRDVTFFSAGLRALGVAKGDRVAVMLSNSPELLIAFYGGLRLGAILVPCPPCTPRELQHLLADSGATVMVVDRSLQRGLETIRAATSLRSVVVVDGDAGIGLRGVLAGLFRGGSSGEDAASVRFSDLVRDVGEPVQAAVAATDPALIAYSIDAKGSPIGVVYPHQALLAGSLQCRAWLGEISDGEATVVLPSALSAQLTRFTAALTLATQAAATMLLRIEASGTDGDQQGRRISSLLVGAYLPFGASAPTHCLPLSSNSPTPIGTIGVPLPDVESRIFDLETGETPLGPDEEGELAIRGPQLLSGFHGRPAQTERATRGGWLRTGERARTDENGYVFITGRVRSTET